MDEIRNPDQDQKSPDDKVHTIILIDDHPLYRQGVMHFLQREKGLNVLGEAADTEEGMRLVQEKRPDLAVVDLSLQKGNGIDFVKAVKAFDPQLPVLVHSMYDESLYAERALKAGARGYVEKTSGPEVLAQAIHSVLRGQIYLSDQMMERVLERRFSGGRDSASSVSRLSDRELEVFQLIGAGLTTNEIAKSLQLSVKTIETYRAKIKSKMSLKNNMELIQRAVHMSQWEQAGKVA